MHMDRISYPISNIDISHTVQALETKGAIHDKAHFYIDGYNIADHDNISKVLEQLVHKGWLNSPSDFNECERRVNLLSLISEFSMADVVLEYSDKTYLHLDHDPHISMEFKRNDDSALEMVYSATYSDVEGEVFTLNCKMLLGDDFTLNENKARVYFEFNDNCPIELRKDLDCRTVTERIIDWFKKIFSPSSYIAANTASFTVNDRAEIQIPPDDDYDWDDMADVGIIRSAESSALGEIDFLLDEIDELFDGTDHYSNKIDKSPNEGFKQLTEELGAVKAWDRNNGYQYVTVPIADIENSE